MKCPSCHSLMYCKSEIHKVPGQPGKERMDLHCYNRGNPKDPNRCHFTAFMGVITEDPKEWQCHEYQFDFKYKNNTYILRSFDRAVDPRHQSFYRDPNDAKTLLYVGSGNKADIELSYFIPISTGDDMHEEAEKLFHRLRNLIIYS